MLYVVKILRDYLYLSFRKKLFSKKFAFLLSHNNKSKIYPIVLKFGTDVAFIYLQIEFVTQKIGPLRKKIFEIKNLKKNFEPRFLREYLIYRLEILTSYCTNWRLYVVKIKISRDYLHLFFRKKLFLKKFAFLLWHDNTSKNCPIALKFDTILTFIYLQIKFVAQKIGP